MQRFFRLLLFSVFIASPLAIADERRDTLHQIEMAKQEVVELEKVLSQLKVQRGASQKELRKTETEIANLEKKIATLKKEQAETVSKLAWLTEEQQKTELKRTEQEQIFATQAKAAYEGGQQEYLRLLLNQQEPEKVSRMLVYYDYLSQARLVQLSEFKETIKQLKDIEIEMQQYRAQLDSQNEELQAQHNQLAALRKKYRLVLASLNKQITDKGNRLAQREKDQVELNKLLRAIDSTLERQARERSLTQLPSTANANKNQNRVVVANNLGYTGSFAKAKGKLSWPLSGKIIASYGSTRGGDERSKWDGVLIAANRGATVKAIHEGRIVYSDWLRGTGWLIIIDHGQGYYSLYGHNQSLLKKVGTTVKAGESIATAGNSGGSNEVALYFSIRKQGQTVDPTLWCR